MREQKLSEASRRRHEGIDRASIGMVIHGEQKKRSLSRMRRMRTELENYHKNKYVKAANKTHINELIGAEAPPVQGKPIVFEIYRVPDEESDMDSRLDTPVQEKRARRNKSEVNQRGRSFRYPTLSP